MRIQYASDLHLEFNWYKGGGGLTGILKPVAPVLVLAGDIGNPCQPIYQEFLRVCAGAWDHVVVVAGNHEFYNKHDADRWRFKAPDTVADRLAACRAAAAAAGANVHFLDRGRVDIGDLAFLGCTLWTNVAGAEGLIESRMSDCHVICAEGSPWRRATAADIQMWHLQDRTWLEGELAACCEEGRGAVVVSHHLPTFDLIAARFQGHPLNAGFASALDDLIEEPVRAWICGHSHVGSVIHKGAGGRIPCALNPRGYPGEGGCGYCAEMFMDVCDAAGPGELEVEPALVVAGSSTVTEEHWEDESVSAPSLQRPAAPSQSSVAAGMPQGVGSESDTSPESVVFL